MFYPFPWVVGVSIKAVYASLFGLIRLGLLLFACIKLTQEKFLILAFGLVPSVFFALGTTNYGTSMRHHILTWWALVLVGLPSFIELFKENKIMLHFNNKQRSA